MQALLQTRMFNRIIMLVLITTVLIAASWRLIPGRDVSSSLEDVYGYLVDSTSRTNASTDTLIQTLQERLRTTPNDWQSYSQLGLAYLQRARETGDPSYYQKTEEALDKALSFQPDDYVSISGKGALALARHDFHAALEWGERAVQINPDRSYAYGVVADAQIELGLYTEAVETLQTMVNLRPDMSSYSRISYAREIHGDMDGALEMMQLAVDSGLPTSEGTAWVRTQLATLYFSMGNLDQAELEYRRTLQDRPGYVYALAGLGRIQAARGNMNEAIELLTKATDAMPLPEFVILLGDLYQANGQPDLAQRQYDLLAAIEKLFESNGVDMDLEMALFNADHDRELAGTLEQAQLAYDNRPSIQAADVLAWVLYQAGNYEQAQIYSQEALRLGTQDALKLFHAGMIAYRLGDDEQAREYLEQALLINPHFSILYSDEARQILQMLDSK